MRRTALVLCLLGCSSGNEASDAGAALDIRVSDASADATEAPCSDVERFVEAGSVTQLQYLEPYLLVGTTTTLETRSGELDIVASEDMAVEELRGAEGRVVAFDGSDARLFALGEGGELGAAGRIDLAGDSVLALRESHLFAFRYPVDARINTMEARDLAELAEPVSLGQVSVAGTGPADLRVAGDVAYAIDSVDRRMTLIDVADPQNMQVADTVAIPDLTRESQLFVAGGRAFVGTADGVAQVDLATLSLAETSEGGALLVRAGDRVATASETQVFVYRLAGANLEAVATLPAAAAPTALAWTGNSLVVGSRDGLRIRRCALP